MINLKIAIRKSGRLNEAADLMYYHYLVLLIAKGYVLEYVIRVLKERHK